MPRQTLVLGQSRDARPETVEGQGPAFRPGQHTYVPTRVPLRRRPAVDRVDLDAANAGRGRVPGRARRRPDRRGMASTPRRMARAYAELLTPAAVRPDHVPQRRGLRRAGPGPRHPDALGLRAPPAAVRRRRPRRLPARRPDPRAVQARPGRRAVRPPAAGAGAAHQAGRRLAAGNLAPARRRRGHRGRAPVHDAARRPAPPAPAPSPRRCTGSCATTRAPGPSSSPSHGRPRRRLPWTPCAHGVDREDPAFVIVGAGLAGAKAAETLRAEGFTGPDRAGRRRAGPALRAAAAVQGLPARQAPTGTRPSCTRRPGTPSTTSTCASATAVIALDPAAHDRSRSPTASGCATTSCCSPPARRRARLDAARRRPATASTTCARSPTATRSATAFADGAARGHHRRRLDRAGDRGRGPRRRAGTSPCSSQPSCRCCGCSAPRWRRSSPTCTASTASTCAAASAWPSYRRRRAGHRRSSCGDGTELPADLVAGRGRHRAERRAGRGRRARRRQRHRRRRAPARPSDPDVFAAGDVANAVPPAARPAPPGRALGQRPATGGPAAARSMLGQDVELRPAAVLLHRPVRPRHGVRRLRRPGRVRPGGLPRRRRQPASSSRSGCPAAGCWPA